MQANYIFSSLRCRDASADGAVLIGISGVGNASHCARTTLAQLLGAAIDRATVDVGQAWGMGLYLDAFPLLGQADAQYFKVTRGNLQPSVRPAGECCAKRCEVNQNGRDAAR